MKFVILASLTVADIADVMTHLANN